MERSRLADFSPKIEPVFMTRQIVAKVLDYNGCLGADHLILGGLWFFLWDQTYFSTPSLNVQFFSDLIKSKQFFSQW